jgi:hypothetical protein
VDGCTFSAPSSNQLLRHRRQGVHVSGGRDAEALPAPRTIRLHELRRRAETAVTVPATRQAVTPPAGGVTLTATPTTASPTPVAVAVAVDTNGRVGGASDIRPTASSSAAAAVAAATDQGPAAVAYF